MSTIADVRDFLDKFAPPSLAEDWDNVGLLVGDPERPVERIMTCLTVTGASADEARGQNAQLIVAHHPLPYRPLKRLTTETTPGRLLLELIQAGIAIYSPHTAFDSAGLGINRQLADGLELNDIRPLRPWNAAERTDSMNSDIGAGRYGEAQRAMNPQEIADRLKNFLKVDHVQLVGDANRPIRRIAVACGSAGEFLAPARDNGCEMLVTGETSFHTCLEAEATGIALLLPGHYASERFAVERLADILSEQFRDEHVWASRDESDPLRWL